MHNSNLAYNYLENSWNLPEWDYIVSEISETFQLSINEKNCFYNNHTAQIIATIPFEAKCNNPERTAIAHLSLYMIEKKRSPKYCSHNPDDDKSLFSRLFLISNFEGGNQNIIDHGMNVLALIMLNGYKKSMKEDKKNNTYNPFVSGAWDYRTLKNHLLSELNKITVPNIDWIFKYITECGW